MEVQSELNACRPLSDSAVTKQAVATQSAHIKSPLEAVVRPELLSYRILKPLQSGLMDVPLIGEAYRCWSEVWSQTFRELDGVSQVWSDDFTRQDEVGALFHGYECVALTCFRFIDLANPMHQDDSYFRIWTPAQRQAACRAGTRVCVGSQITISPSWRRARGCSLKSVVVALQVDRFHASGADALLGTMRDDRGMSGLAHRLGADTLGQAELHGVPVTLVAVYRNSTRPPMPDLEEGIIRKLGESFANGGQ